MRWKFLFSFFNSFVFVIILLVFCLKPQVEIHYLNEQLASDKEVLSEKAIVYDSVPVKEEKRKEIVLTVPLICQYPSLPTGCESVAATMVLHFYGENVTSEIFAGQWLKSSMAFYVTEGKLFGPDPYKVFVGDPFHKNSYGCFADPIVNAVNDNSSLCTAEKIKGCSLEELCTEYIDKNQPLLIWATMGMKSAKEGNSWHFQDGTYYTWTAGEHCLVLVGYNETQYFLNDPMTGTTVSYEKDLVEKRYKELGAQAVYISIK